MGCCGNGHTTVRQQPIKTAKNPKPIIVQRANRKEPISIRKVQSCPLCGHITMEIMSKSRIKTQCTNTNCKHVLS